MRGHYGLDDAGMEAHIAERVEQGHAHAIKWMIPDMDVEEIRDLIEGRLGFEVHEGVVTVYPIDRR